MTLTISQDSEENNLSPQFIVVMGKLWLIHLPEVLWFDLQSLQPAYRSVFSQDAEPQIGPSGHCTSA